MTDEIPYRPAPLIPRTPTQVREEMVRHRLAFAEKVGGGVSSADVERGVTRDLEIVEGLKRGQDPTRRPRGKGKGKRGRRAERAVEARQDDGLRLVEPGRTFDRTPVLNAPAIALGFKWSAAVRRLGFIMQGTTPAPTMEQSVATANCPDLALEWWRAYADYRLRHRTTRHNPFLGLSDRDASRKLIRIAMDLCDRSTGRLGPWWVR